VRRGAGAAAASLPAAILLGVLLLATACTGGSTPTATPTPSSTALQGHLLWWDISAQTGAQAAMRALIAEFEQLHPGVTIEYVNIPASEARGRIDTAAQTTSGAPDVLTLDSSWVADFASRGYLARLDDTTAVDPVDDQLPNLLAAAKYDGRIVALPRSADGPALLYNVSLLKRADVAVPRTWTDLTADRPKLLLQGAQTLYAPATSDGLLPWIYGEGGDLVNADAKTIDVNSAAAVAGLTNRVALQTSGVAVTDTSTESVDAMRAAFRQGSVAMILDSAAALPGLVGGTATPTLSSIGIAPVPAGSVTSSTPLTGTAYAVYAGSPTLEPAYQFVHFLDSTPAQVALAARLGLLPTRTSAYATPAVKEDPVVAGFETVVRTGTPLPPVPGSAQLLPPLDDALRHALTGDGTPQKLLDAVAASYSRLLPDFTTGSPNG
jgi:arabinogalactan oligomer / maltooligosaccharide transport system substrate-binding protein